MRIALVVPSFADPAHKTVAQALSQEYTRLGHDVFIFADEIGPDRMKIPPEKAARQLEQLLQRHSIDICHVQFFCHGLNYLGSVRFPDQLSVVLTYQGASLEFIDHPDVFRHLTQRADSITSVSRHGLVDLVSQLPCISGKACLVYNGVYAEEPAFCQKISLDSDSFILSVGRLAAYKGMDLLAMSFAYLVEHGYDLDLVICGPDQTNGHFARFIQQLGLGNRIHLMGSVDRSTVQSLLQQSLFFVLPSRQENFPMALLEAMAAGKAVAAARVGGIPEIIRHGENGLLVCLLYTSPSPRD